MELQNFLAILWRRKLIIALTLVIVVSVVWAGTYRTAPIYQATTTLRFATPVSGSTDWVGYDTVYADRLLNTYVDLAKSTSVMDALKQQLGVQNLPPITVEALANSELIQITVESTNPDFSKRAAESLANLLITTSIDLNKPVDGAEALTGLPVLKAQVSQAQEEYSQAQKKLADVSSTPGPNLDAVNSARQVVDVKQVAYNAILQRYTQAQFWNAAQSNHLSIVDPAVLPTIPSKPNKIVNLLLGVLAGLVGGIAAALIVEQFDRTLYNPEEIDQIVERPKLGSIPERRWNRNLKYFKNNTPQAEAIKQIRTNFHHFQDRLPSQTLLITSSMQGEGKSIVAVSLADQFAQAGGKVILIDANLRQPSIHRLLSLPNKKGLADLLTCRFMLEEVIQDCKLSGTQVITSGGTVPNPVELLGSSQMASILKQIKQHFDFVLIDAPALVPLADSSTLVPMVDAVLMVAAPGKVDKDTLKTACQKLADARAETTFLVINRA